MAEEEDQRDSFRVYFAGASLAFGLPFLTIELLALIYGGSENVLSIFSTLFIALHFVGGLLGGYSAARIAKGDLIRVGTVTGVLAYIFQQVVFTIFYGGGVVGDAWTMIGLIGGSSVGAVIYKSRVDAYSRIMSRRAEEEKEEDLEDQEDLEPSQ
jgi:hypothetical protein